MAIRYPGRATIDPSAPQAIGICDRCGLLYNLRDLRYQPVYAGPNILTTRLRVCWLCWDEPNEQLRTIRIPPDPDPVADPRIQNFAAAEQNFLTLTTYVGKPSMFLAQSLAQGEIDLGLGFALLYTGVSAMGTELEQLLQFSALATGASSVAADLELVPAPATRTEVDEYSFVNSGSYTESGATLGAEAANRIIVVSVSGYNDTSIDGLDSVTIGGVSATLAVEVVRNTNSPGTDSIFSSVYWALVPTGTTGDIAFVYTGDLIAGAVCVYRVIGANTTTPVVESITGQVASGDVSAVQDIPAGSCTIATAMLGQSSAAATSSWTNATEDFEVSLSVGVRMNFGFASREDVTAASGTTITASVSSDNLLTQKTIAIASFQP